MEISVQGTSHPMLQLFAVQGTSIPHHDQLEAKTNCPVYVLDFPKRTHSPPLM